MGSSDQNLAQVFSRRGFLLVSAGTLGAVGASSGLIWAGAPSAYAATSFEAVRVRHVEALTGGKPDTSSPSTESLLRAYVQSSDARARASWGALDKSSGRTTLWPDLAPFNNPGQAASSLNRLRELAISWATPSSSLYQDQRLRDDLLGALDFWSASYSATSRQTGNWWFWEIGMPGSLVDLGILLFTELGAERKQRIDSFVARFVADPNRRTNFPQLRETGANRTDKAYIVIRHGLLMDDSSRILLGRDALSDVAGGGTYSVFGYVNSGDGFYRDGSFVQHVKLAYIGSYGLVAFDGLADILALLAGTAWAVTDPAARVIYDAALSNAAWFIFDAQMMDAVRGRAVSREGSTDQYNGHAMAGAFARLAQSSEEAGPELRSLIKGWLSRNQSVPTETGMTLSRALLVQSLLDDPAIMAAPPLVRHVQTADQDRVVHHAGDWAMSFSLSSNRMGRYEWGNGENNQGWYHGDGMVQTFLADDRGAYSGNYWATSDPYHLPGVTNGLQPRENGAISGTGIPGATQTWAGGVGWLDRVGTVGMDHLAYDRNLSAKKSWFCLPEMIVALGAGITATQGQTVHTTVESRKLDPSKDQPLLVDGQAVSGSGVQTLNPSWAHLAGVGGYLFLDNRLAGLNLPAASSVRSLREVRSGSWRAINVDGPEATVQDQYQTLYFDHGTNPSGAAYAYAVLPNATAEQTRTRAAASSRDLEVAVNTTTAQGIVVRGTGPSEPGLTMINFFAAGSAGGITITQPAAVVLGADPDRLGGLNTVLTLSDPSRHGQSVTVTVPVPAGAQGGSVLEYPERSSVQAAAAALACTTPTAGTRGHELRFRFGPAGQTVSHSTRGAGVGQWQYSAGWRTGSLDSYSTTAGSTAQLRFRGSRVYLQSAPSPDQGIIKVSLNGGQSQEVDLFELVRNGVRVVASFGGLDATAVHTLTVTCTGRKNPRSGAGAAALSGAVVVP